MKRKQLLKIIPKEPGENDPRPVVVVQTAEETVMLCLWGKHGLVGRYFISTRNLEYETYDEESGLWGKTKLYGMLGYEKYGNWYCNTSRIDKDFEVVGEVKKAQQMLRPLEDYPHSSIFSAVENLECIRSRTVRENAENRRQQKIRDLMALVPPLPDGFREWILEAGGMDKHYALPDGDGNLQFTCCGYRGAMKAKSGGKGVCPACGKQVTVNRRVKSGIVEKAAHCAILQNMDENHSAARHFDVSVLWTGGKRHLILSESERLILYRKDKKWAARVFYAQDARGVEAPDFDDQRNHYNRRCWEEYMYPYGIREALEGTVNQGCARNLEMLAAAGVKLEYARIMANSGNRGVMALVEYLFKGRFQRLLEEVAESLSYYGNREGCSICGLDTGGKSQKEIFGCGTQRINRLRQKDGGAGMLYWLQVEEHTGQKISGETLDWMERNRITETEIRFVLGRMSPQQIMNYVTRQMREQYPDKTAKAVIGQWGDYMEMCRKRGKDLDDEMVYRPRELKRRHEEIVEEIREEQAMKLMEENQEAGRKRAQEMREKYPEAERILAGIKQKYEYDNGEYMVVVPDNLMKISMEGYALHHCVGSSERYFERIENQETYICFLRRAEKPDTPFYTIEIEPGGAIRQHRSYFDEEPGIQEIRGFLKEWQKEVKKRISEEDRELAKASKYLREKNINELKEKNNTRVLQGLMEDFMEAAG